MEFYKQYIIQEEHLLQWAMEHFGDITEDELQRKFEDEQNRSLVKKLSRYEWLQELWTRVGESDSSGDEE